MIGFSMTRTQLFAGSLVALTAGAFSACTFGADDFEIVEADSSLAGSGGVQSSGGTGSGEGGEGVGGGAGSGTGGVNGTGGGAPFTCTPQGDPISVFEASDVVNGAPLGSLDDQRVRVMPAGPNAAVVVASWMVGNLNQIVLRLVTNDGNGLGSGDIVAFSVPNGRMLLGAVDAQTFVVKLMVAWGNTIEEYRFDISGDQLEQQAATTTFPFPSACDLTTGGAQQIEFMASYQEGLSYLVSCVPPTNNRVLYVAQGPQLVPESIAVPGDDNNAPYQYVKAFNQHYIFTGEKIGPWLDLRVGSDTASLSELGTVQLSVAPGIFSSELLVAKPDGSGLFMVGAAVTGAQAGTQLPIVPADGYAGPVDDPSGLFVVPPDGVKKYATYAAADDYYGLNGIAFVGDNVVKTGVRFQTNDAVAMSLFAPDGTLLARDAVVYTAAGSTIDEHLSGAVAPLGSGSIVSWVENGEVRARLMTCSEN